MKLRINSSIPTFDLLINPFKTFNINKFLKYKYHLKFIAYFSSVCDLPCVITVSRLFRSNDNKTIHMYTLSHCLVYVLFDCLDCHKSHKNMCFFDSIHNKNNVDKERTQCECEWGSHTLDSISLFFLLISGLTI
jgi:hypothetical protein